MYLCQEHLLLAWALVQEQIADGRPAKRPELVPGLKVPDPDPYEGWVYYLRVGGLMKIGHSMDLVKRLSSYPPGSELIAARCGSRKFERAEHIRYDVHLAEGREWFHISDELIQDVLREDDNRPRNESDLFLEGCWRRIKAQDARDRVTYGRKAI
ncbi:GIY-YIG nuclease family protein [Rhodococcus marinonascens]|uniref:GIY-YIG nuclease family protein n=1 Tax=Rhodococcus marinonascens TaxID=38311 RepID=UPI00093509AD|nr:GIY-YIG nuclease family protein [Rhodococcus marinonascens]